VGNLIATVERAKLSESANHDDVALRSVLEQVPALIWTTDHNFRITSNWGSGMQAAGIKPEHAIGRTVYDFLRNNDARSGAHTLEGGSSRIEIREQGRDYEIRLEPLRDAAGGVGGYIAAGFDITDRKRSEDQVRYQATHDALTGLANYREFLDSLEREVRRSGRANRPFGVLLLDVNDLKRINDRWGHLAGNRALRRLAEVLKRQCRSTDLSARYGGDEFAVLMIDADPAMARQVARRVESGLEKDREQPELHVSIGIGMYPEDGRSSAELLEAADKQLYRNKRASHAQMISVR
jgi:diguanylate cyclase (GGDEF)-like protein/PAS domain S-box-containing protein